MKVVKMFFLGIAEAIKLTFNKKQAQKEADEFELPVCDGPEITDDESQKNYLELYKEYNVNIFTKWFLLALCLFMVTWSIYLIVNKSFLIIAPLVVIVPLYKLYDNRSEMARFRYLFIQFMLKTDEEINSIQKGI